MVFFFVLWFVNAVIMVGVLILLLMDALELVLIFMKLFKQVIMLSFNIQHVA